MHFLPYRTNAAEIFRVFRFLKISQNSQENTCARVSFLIKLQAEGSIFKGFTDSKIPGNLTNELLNREFLGLLKPMIFFCMLMLSKILPLIIFVSETNKIAVGKKTSLTSCIT